MAILTYRRAENILQLFFCASDKPFEFTMKFRLAENYPVDLYYVMDLSNSMKDDKEKLAALGEDLGKNQTKPLNSGRRCITLGLFQ